MVLFGAQKDFSLIILTQKMVHTETKFRGFDKNRIWQRPISTCTKVVVLVKNFPRMIKIATTWNV